MIIFCLIIFPVQIFAQWQEDTRLTFDPGDSRLGKSKSITADSDILQVVWTDNRIGNDEIYYRRSYNSGISWIPDIRLTNNAAASENASVAVSGTDLYVVWDDNRDGNYEIFFKHSADGGVNWSADTRLTYALSNSICPSISVSGTNIYLVWHDSRFGNYEIYYKNSPDAGSTWGPDMRLTNDTNISVFPSIAVSGTNIHVVWQDSRAGNNEIYYKHSSDGGLNWGSDSRLTAAFDDSNVPHIALFGIKVYVTWEDRRSGNFEIYYKRSPDAGLSWGPDIQLTNNASASINSSVAVAEHNVHIVWSDSRDGNSEIYYKHSSNGGITWIPDVRLTNNSAYSEDPSIAVSGILVHAIWKDNRDGNYEVYYKRNPTGNNIGIKKISTEIPENFSLSQNYPNPFNPLTHFEFRIAKFGSVLIKIYNSLGIEIGTLVNESLLPGTYQGDWDGHNYPSGVYYYCLSLGNPSASFRITKKMVLLK